ncbi:nuclear distribution protein nudE homolog isoform X2 [Phlebotomus papatasi]|uniref:nuclear distribution protein nudE homolog isoform X2 n=1 Tax=Phlebotomus papatasi TaxID=29031 RepID=UPI0024843EDC|nr:nuclear distribution protein nudE homolog isoform X2 [Phlebotomus papatasi]
MDSPTESESKSLQYWKDRATYWKHELDEFTESSHQLEQELEYSLKQKEEQIRDLRLKLNKQQQDNEMLRLKMIKCENEITQMESRYQSERKDKEELAKYMRELEQKNDDLERAHRIVTETVAEFERSLNREYEKNVMLEVEFEMEKESAQEQLQRLMDETRDLKQELKIRQRPIGNNNAQLEGSVSSETQTTPRSRAADIAAAVQACPDSQSRRDNSIKQSTTSTMGSADRLKNGNALPSSTRTTALAIVADLLRRVNTIDATLKELKQQPRSTEESLQVTKTASCDNNIHIK